MISVALDKLVTWKDERLVMNENNSFWKANKSMAAIDYGYVRKCLWTPELKIANEIQKYDHNPTSSNLKHSNSEFYLSKSRVIASHRRNARITFSCPMDFSNFPFDTQVNRYFEPY